jgi:FkbM family methyltransferase
MKGLIRPLWFEPVRHCYRLARDRNYRTLCFLESRLGRMPRFSEGQVRVNGMDIRFPDAASFLSTFREIFVEKIYAFPCSGEAPVILDLGANIGLSVIFFKMLHPGARVIAYEADPRIFAFLEANVHGNGFRDVELINRAAWHEDGVLRFLPEGADGGRVTLERSGRLIEVQSVDIATVLRGRRFDLLKMDIEGAEELVLPACREALAEIPFIFVEYHSRAGQRQHLDSVFKVLADAGYRVHLQSLAPVRSPFLGVREQCGFDLQLNIFGWRE